MTRPPRRAAPTLLLAAALLFVGGAHAQKPPYPIADEPPTRGPELPAGALAGDADATALRLDPANLGFLSSWNLVAAYSGFLGGVPRHGGGGLYAATPLPYLRRVSVAASIEMLQPGSAFSYPSASRLSLGLGVRVVPMLSLGAAYGHVFLGRDGAGLSHDVDTLDLALAARLGRFVSLAAVAHDLSAPQTGTAVIPRSYQLELAIRPTGSYRFELGLSARLNEVSGHVDPSARVQIGVYPGVLLRAALEYVPILANGGPTANLLRATAGVQIDFAPVGAAVYALFGTPGDGALDTAVEGVAGVVRVSGDRYPAVWRPLRFERVDVVAATTSPDALPALLEHLRRLALDPRTDGILAIFGDAAGSWATMEELRAAFLRLRAAGKRVVVFAAELGTRPYYAAVAADRIVLDPAGGLRFLGVRTQTLYLKGTLDALGVRAEVVRHAEYKSAPEQATRTGPSDEAKEVRAALLDDIDARLRAAVAEGRKLDPARVTALRDTGLFTPRAAAQAGLIDEVRTGEEVPALLDKLLGRRVEVYAADRRPDVRAAFSRPAIALLHVDGDIVEGRSRHVPILDRRVAGHDSLIAALAAARSDDNVRAIVVRIDSPGGSAIASDLVSRELLRSRAAKPVICSLGDTAASGGYYIAAGCDTILADPSTVTGSIGIFSGKLDLSGLAGKLGISIDAAGRGAHTGIDSWATPWTDEERALVSDNLRYHYDRFVETVATGRGRKVADIESVARGRVWTGAQALDKHLVDRLGGLQDAIVLAAERAGLPPASDFDLVEAPRLPTTLLGEVAQLVGLRTEAKLALPAAVVSLLRALPAALLDGPGRALAQLPFALGDD